jgi:hypothetical protein
MFHPLAVPCIHLLPVVTIDLSHARRLMDSWDKRILHAREQTSS